MWSSRSRSRGRAFTLVEVMLVLVIVAIAAAALAAPLAAQMSLRRQEDTRRTLEEARDALLGFAAAHGRLPCPAVEASRGMESFAPGAGEGSGECEAFHGFLPAASLGLAPLDADGFARDAWLTPANRIRYAVFGGTVQGVRFALTRSQGMRLATLAGLGGAPHYIFICTTGARATASGCGPAANQLTRRAAFVLLSLGPNAPHAPAPASDEARNRDGDAVYVAREASAVAGREFDDLVLWVPIHLVIHRLVTAGGLP